MKPLIDRGATYSVTWAYYSQRAGGCITHAQEDGAARAICGVDTTEGGTQTLTEHGGTVSCQRCTRILTKRGVLPLQVRQVFDRRGTPSFVAADDELPLES